MKFLISFSILLFAFSLLNANAPFKLIRSDASKVILEFEMPEYNIAKDKSGYSKIVVNDCSYTDETGFPYLPKFTTLITLPGNKKAIATVKDAEMIYIKNIDVLPTPEPTVDTQEPAKPIAKDYKGYFPATSAVMEENSIWRHLVVSGLNFIPFRYDRNNKTLAIFKKAKIVISFVDNPDPKFPSCPVKKVDPDWDKMYRNRIINYQSKNVGYTDAPPNPEYLIIYKDGTENVFAPLVTWYIRSGFYVMTVPISQIGASVDNVKNYLANAYHSYGIKYVLIIGDYVDIPMYTHRYSAYSALSDTYYAMVDGNDALCEFGIGRFAIKNNDELGVHISRTLYYILTPAFGTWYSHLPLVAHYQEAPGKYEGCCEQIAGFSYTKQQPNFEKIYGSGSQGQKNNQNVSNSINIGSGVVLYRGHGDAISWYYWNVSQCYSTSDVNQLNNEDRYPVVYNICCDNADLRYNNYTFQEALLNKYPGGAVSSLGSSDPSWTNNNHTLAKEIIKATFNEGIHRMSLCKMFADVKLNQEGSYGRDIIYMYWYNADPAAEIRTKDPGILALASDKDTVVQGEGTVLTINVTRDNVPVSGSKVCLWQHDYNLNEPNLYRVDTTNTSGTVLFFVSEQKTGWIQATASFVNTVPALDSIRVEEKSGFAVNKSAVKIPGKTEFLGIFPNPVREKAIFKINLPVKTKILIKVYDLTGKLVKTVYENTLNSGFKSIAWNVGYNSVPNGVYIYTIEANDLKVSKRLVIMR
ncbi:MAG: T9SS type A sorting domain-containing protein [Candidatus Coatesbacteria bacterium]|nr:T9SS type A sorting domain-containing protein [Candidatus Coatesbacteria bacterium]